VSGCALLLCTCRAAALALAQERLLFPRTQQRLVTRRRPDDDDDDDDERHENELMKERGGGREWVGVAYLGGGSVTFLDTGPNQSRMRPNCWMCTISFFRTASKKK
jgi:hypothetical protein